MQLEKMRTATLNELRESAATDCPDLDFAVDEKIGMLLSTDVFHAHYLNIVKFQEICLDLLKMHIADKSKYADLRFFLSEFRQTAIHEFQSKHADKMCPPLFFRTDGTSDGKIFEIQCPGSAWGEYEIIRNAHATIGNDVSKTPSIVEQMIKDLREKFGPDDLIIQHFIDNASRPLQQQAFNNLMTKSDPGIRFVGMHQNAHPINAKLIRTHLFESLFHESFTEIRLDKWVSGEVHYDHPLTPIFEQKFLLALPFDEKYASLFTDEMRDMFPYTSVITPEGVRLEGGEHVTIDEFIGRSQTARDYFIKYAGSRATYNWGSRAVFHAKTQSKPALKKIFDRIISDYHNGSPWVLQKGHQLKAEHDTGQLYEKISGYYGPSGLYGILAMYRSFVKVHGSIDTIYNVIQRDA